MRVKHSAHALLQTFGGGLGAETKVEINKQLAGDDVAGAGAAVDVRHLPAGGREKFVARVPFGREQIGQCGREQMHRVSGEVRVGDVPLQALDGELAAHRAASAVFDGVAEPHDRGRLADDAVVQHVATRGQGVADFDRAVKRRAFFVAGQQESDRQRGLRVRGQKLFHRHHHRRDGAFHVGGTAPVQHAAALRGCERRAVPLRQGAGRHHVGVACEDQCFGRR